MSSHSSRFAPRPLPEKKSRACLRCKLILNEAQFNQQCCPVCVPHGEERLAGDRKNWVEENTTSQFSGMIAVIDADRHSTSWAQRYGGLGFGPDGEPIPLKAGLYALQLPEQKQRAEGEEDLDEYEEDGFIVEGEDEAEGGFDGTLSGMMQAGAIDSDEDDADYQEGEPDGMELDLGEESAHED